MGMVKLIWFMLPISTMKYFRNLYIAKQGTSGYEFEDQGYHVDIHTDPQQFNSLDIAQSITGDVNGDGRTDLVFAFAKNRTLGHVVYLSDQDASGDVFLGRTSLSDVIDDFSPYLYEINNLLLSDVNGDGKDDLIYGFAVSDYLYRVLWLADADGGSFYRASIQRDNGIFSSVTEFDNGQFTVGDVNADGKSDLVWTGRFTNEIGRALYVSSEVGNTFTEGAGYYQQNTITSSPVSSHENTQIQLSDFNSDGYADLVYTYTNSGTFEAVVLTASTTSSGTSFSSAVQSSVSDANTPGNENHHYLFGDLNFDARPDLIWAYNDNANDITQQIHHTPRSYPDHLSQVTDGFNNQINISYEYLADPVAGIHTVGGASVYPVRQDIGRNYAVSSVSQSNGIGGFNNTTYSYSGAKTNLIGRGFLGFTTRTSTDIVRNVRTVDTFLQSYPLITNLKSSVSTNLATNFKVLENFNHWITETTSSNTLFPYLKGTVLRQYELDVNGGERATKITINTIDKETGTLSSSTELIGYGFSGNSAGPFAESDLSTPQLKIVTSNVFLSDLGTNWRPGFLTQETRQFYSNGELTPSKTIVNKTTPIDNYSYLPFSERKFDGSNVWVEMEFTNRDVYGNVTKVTTTANEPGGTVGPYVEDTGPFTDGLYPEWSENRLGQRTNFEYDGRVGLVTEREDPNALKSFSLYDDFGKEVVTQSFAGAVTTSTYTLCTANCGNEKYTVVTKTEHRENQRTGEWRSHRNGGI